MIETSSSKITEGKGAGLNILSGVLQDGCIFSWTSIHRVPLKPNSLVTTMNVAALTAQSFRVTNRPRLLVCVCVCVSSSYSKIVRRVPLGTAASSQDAPLETVDGGPSRVRDMLASLRHDDLVKPLLLIGGFRFDG